MHGPRVAIDALVRRNSPAMAPRLDQGRRWRSGVVNCAGRLVLLVPGCATAAFVVPAPAIYGPDGKHGDYPEVLNAALTRVDNSEGITSLPYTSQRKG
jgi:hypothetical protein